MLQCCSSDGRTGGTTSMPLLITASVCCVGCSSRSEWVVSAVCCGKPSSSSTAVVPHLQVLPTLAVRHGCAAAVAAGGGVLLVPMLSLITGFNSIEVKLGSGAAFLLDKCGTG